MTKQPTAAPLRRRSLAEELAERLRRRIAEGRFEVGGRLPPEPELMRLFGVGRSTVREAVRILCNTGLLSVRQGAGTFVACRTAPHETIEQRLRRADLHDLDEVRQILERAIAERAARHRTEQDLAALERHLADRAAAAETGDLEACIAADIRFHAALAEATHNEILHELYRSAATHLQRGFRHLYTDTLCFAASQPTHARLLREIAARRPEKALETIDIILKEP